MIDEAQYLNARSSAIPLEQEPEMRSGENQPYQPLEPEFKGETLVELLRWRTMRTPEKQCFIMLRRGEHEESILTFADLDKKARAIGANLQRRGLSGSRALMLYQTDLDFVAAFFACLYAGVVGVPATPPQRNRPMPRLAAVLSDSDAPVILTTTEFTKTLENRLKHAAYLSTKEWITTDTVEGDAASSWIDPGSKADDLAYLQYTSGSTAAPKGVMVSHGNLMANSADLEEGWKLPENGKILSWLPHYHDMGLIYGMLQPVFKGVTGYIMSPLTFIQQPIKWLRAIAKFQITHSGAPNFAYDLCVQRTNPEKREGLDLSSWQVAFNGSEPVRRQTMDRFVQAFEPHGFNPLAFCPGYGLAESTLKVCATAIQEMPVSLTVDPVSLENHRLVQKSEQEGEARPLVGCGHPIRGTRIQIVNPDTYHPCRQNEIGEIWVSGPSIAGGYWQKEKETEATFRAKLAGKDEEAFLRTGDLGIFHDNQLYVTGRLKDLIIIAGRNLYPQDIELTAQEAHSAVRPNCCAAFSIEVEENEKLIVVAEISRGFRGRAKSDEGATTGYQTVIEDINRAVTAEHQVDVSSIYLIKEGGLPKTSSGKVQRRVCKEAYLNGTLPGLNLEEISPGRGT